MKINEIFKSIEGEGIFQGYLTLFIRLAECNLNCKWCDTKYSFNEYKIMSLNKILNIVKNENINKITITGGEPFLQQNELLLLITEIKKLNKEICIYTNGTIEIDKNLFDLVHIILDYKLDYTDKINNNNITNLKNGILKFVIDDINKFKNLNLDIVKIYNNNNKIHITPAFNYIDNKDIADYLINNNLNNIKLALQQHKYIWNPEERSV